MTCFMCQNEADQVRHHDIYAIGSEGIKVCPDCDLLLCKFVRMLHESNFRVYWEHKKREKLG